MLLECAAKTLKFLLLVQASQPVLPPEKTMTRLFAALRIEALETREVPAVLFVDDDRIQIPTAKYTTIQAAVDAASAGDTVVVARGTYREQVKFAANADRITLRSQNPLQAIIQAPAVLTGTKSIVTINGASGVTVRGFTITGPAVATDGLEYGVAVLDGSSATVENNRITGIRNNPLNGSQTGVGVLVFGETKKTSAIIEDNTITDYQKGGVVVFGPTATAKVKENTIVGIGATGLIAQNGIQVSDGANAVVKENSVRGNIYTGTGVTAAGIYVDTAGSVVVSENRVFNNSTGVLIVDTDAILVTENRVTRNLRNGIDLVGVVGGLVSDNRVENNKGTGVLLSNTTQVAVTDNRIEENGLYGLALTDGSSKNLVFSNRLHCNDGFDAFDDTISSLTGGTANLWYGNCIGTKNNKRLR
jgi:parallel beta-helix repeat protein